MMEVSSSQSARKKTLNNIGTFGGVNSQSPLCLRFRNRFVVPTPKNSNHYYVCGHYDPTVTVWKPSAEDYLDYELLCPPTPRGPDYVMHTRIIDDPPAAFADGNAAHGTSDKDTASPPRRRIEHTFHKRSPDPFTAINGPLFPQQWTNMIFSRELAHEIPLQKARAQEMDRTYLLHSTSDPAHPNNLAILFDHSPPKVVPVEKPSKLIKVSPPEPVKPSPERQAFEETNARWRRHLLR